MKIISIVHILNKAESAVPVHNKILQKENKYKNEITERSSRFPELC